MNIPTVQTIQSEKSYTILSDKNHSFSIKIANLTSSIEISASFEEYNFKHFYKKNFDLNSLERVNRYFSIYDSINEIYQDLILYLDKNQTKIIEESNIIKIKIPIGDIRVKEIIFELSETEKSEKDKFNEIFSTISELMTGMNKLKEENKNIIEDNKKIKEEIKMIKEENQKLKEDFKMINEENKTLKDKLKDFMNFIPYLEKYKKKCEDKKNNRIIHNLDSLIIKDNEKYNITLKNWINPNLRIKSELLYRLTRDGEEYQTFHKLCDYKGPTIILTKLTDGTIIGSYTPLDWNTSDCWKSDPNMFVFSLTENKRAMKQQSNNLGIYCHNLCGPYSCFLRFHSNKKMNEPYIYFDSSTYSINTQVLAPGKNATYYKADEVEVHKIIIG